MAPDFYSMNAQQEWTVRSATEADQNFLCSLYACTREQEEPLCHWPKDHRAKFLRMQFEAQDAHYRKYYQNKQHWIICVGKHDAGRILLDWQKNDLRIVDISLLPRFRGKGLGSSILRHFIAKADETGIQTSLHALHGSPALRLYQKLGFKSCPSTDATRQFLVRTNTTQQTATKTTH